MSSQIKTVNATVVSKGHVQFSGKHGLVTNAMTHTAFKEYPIGTKVRFKVFYDKSTVRLSTGSVEVIEENVNSLPEKKDWVKISTAWFSPQEVEVFEAAETLTKSGAVFNLKLIGNSGYGKTVRAQAWADHAGKDYAYIDCGKINAPLEWFGTKELRSGETVFVENDVVPVLQAGNAVILLDELSRTKPHVTNPILSVLDYRKEARVNGKTYTVGPNTLFVGTENTGHKFTGTFKTDAALNNRFDAVLRVDAPPAHIEKQIVLDYYTISDTDNEILISVLNKLRQSKVIQESSIDVTTRPAIKIAALLSVGMDMRTAFGVVLLNNVPNNSPEWKEINDTININ